MDRWIDGWTLFVCPGILRMAFKEFLSELLPKYEWMDVTAST